jgi:hypothetical protein
MYGYAQNGNYLWQYSLFNDPDTEYTSSTIAMQTKDNSFILGGQINSKFLFVKTDANTNILWKNSYDVILGGMNDCRPTRDGGYILVGSGGQGFDGIAIKTNNIGTVDWQDDFKSTILAQYGMYTFSSVDTTIDGKIVIAGRGAPSGSKGFIIKLSLTKNVEKFVGFNDASDLKSIKTTKGGDLFIVGSTITLGNGGIDILIIKSNSSGDIISQAVYGTSGDDERGISLKMTSDGGCIVTGSHNWIIKTDENGNVD